MNGQTCSPWLLISLSRFHICDASRLMVAGITLFPKTLGFDSLDGTAITARISLLREKHIRTRSRNLSPELDRIVVYHRISRYVPVNEKYCESAPASTAENFCWNWKAFSLKKYC